MFQKGSPCPDRPDPTRDSQDHARLCAPEEDLVEAASAFVAFGTMLSRQGSNVTKSSFQIARFLLWAVSAVCLISIPARAADLDLTLFGGIHHQGQLRESVGYAGNGGSSAFYFNPTTFGVFGARFGHGKVIGGEHTFAYTPNFIQSGNNAFIYNSNLRVQAPLPVLKPYGTVGAGLVHSGGTPGASFGTRFAFNYGGGVKAMAGPVGVDLDLRGYTLPSVNFFPIDQQRLTFFQVSAGIVFSFGQ